MSNKETSGEIATIAGRVLNLEPHDDVEYDDLLTYAKKLAGSALSQYEIEVLDLTTEQIITVPDSNTVIGNYRVEPNALGGLTIVPLIDDAEETNFQFYVDGYTLASTDVIGEILATAPDGKTAVLKSKSLTDFLDRRLALP